jgi:hypothetical protein
MLRQETTSGLNSYLKSFKSLTNELKTIKKPIKEQNLVFWLLNGLRPFYESFVTTSL